MIMPHQRITAGTLDVSESYAATFHNDGRSETIIELNNREAGHTPAYATSPEDAAFIAEMYRRAGTGEPAPWPVKRTLPELSPMMRHRLGENLRREIADLRHDLRHWPEDGSAAREEMEGWAAAAEELLQMMRGTIPDLKAARPIASLQAP